MQISRRSALSGGVALAATPNVSLPASAALKPETAVALDRAAREAMSANACPGVQLAIARDGQILFSRGYGTANRETETRVTATSVFRIGSLTKQFTAACILKLAAENKLQIDAPVARYLPFMGRLKSLSLLELLHHTAGLHSDDSDVSCSRGAKPPISQIAQAEQVAGQAKPFDFEPGTAWLYSNANYILLGAVVEKVTGKPFREALAQIIFGPLGLRATAVDRSSDVVAGRAAGYTPSASGRFDNAAFVEVADAGGAGSVRSTASDLCRWHSTLLSNQLFPYGYVKTMLMPGRLRDGRLSGANRFSAADTHYGEVQYACGLFVSPPSDPHPGILHYGAINGFAALLQTYTAARLTFAVLCNGDIGPAVPFHAVRRSLEESLPAPQSDRL